MSDKTTRMFPPDTLATARLHLRRPKMSDACAIYEGYARSENVTRFLMWPPHDSVETTRYFLADAMLAWTEGMGHRAWVMEEKSAIDATPIGMIGTTVSGHSVEVGYVLSPTYQAQGYMSEALNAVTECALSTQTIARIWATCHVDNKASQRVLERCGYTREGCLKKSGHYPNLVPPICDSLMFAKVR